MDQRRKFERIPLDLAAEVEVLGTSPGEGIPSLTISGNLNTVSPEGLGLILKRKEPALKPGKRVTIRFASGTYEAELPARVAWHGSPDHPTALGVELQLMLLPALSRHTYAQWIATRVQRDRDDRRSREIPLPKRR